jgi:hypothetical protein
LARLGGFEPDPTNRLEGGYSIQTELKTQKDMDSVIRFELMMKNGFAVRCLRPLGYTEVVIGGR